MATKLVQDSSLTTIADAIRAKSGTSASLTFPSGFASAIEDIPTGGTLQTKSKTYTPTESQQTEAITADSGYDGLSEVDVTVNAVSSTYVGTGITRRSSTDLTVSGATVTAPSGYYSAQASKAVSSGTAGTPTATKGTVSNHSVSITPRVTNTTGYIAGGTKTGTAISVSASELVSGSETKTANGTYDVTNLASLIVNVASGGGGLEYEEGTYSPSSDAARLTVQFANSHSEAPTFIVFADATNTSDVTSNSNWLWVWVDYYKWFGGGLSFGSSSYRYASSLMLYRASSTSSLSTGTVHCTHNSDSSTASGTSYPRYWTTETGFRPYTNSTSRYWRSGRTYKWIAAWK